MKKLLLLSILICTICGCRKIDSSDFNNSDLIKDKVLLWMDEQKINDANANSFIDSLKLSAQWQKASATSINNSEYLIYVPVKYNSNLTGLTLIVNKKNEQIETGYLSEIKIKEVAEIKTVSPQKIILDFYQYKRNGFSGSISAYNITNRFLWEMGYKNGYNTYKKKFGNYSYLINSKGSINEVSVNKVHEKLLSQGTNSCTYFYLVTTYSDGSQDWEYLGVSCTGGDCEQTKVISKNGEDEIKTFCGGGGGSSSSSNNTQRIVNSITNPCLRSIVNNIINNNLTNAVNDILTNVFNGLYLNNLTFDESTTIHDLQGNILEAQTSGNFGPTVTGLNININLNPNELAGASQEYIASVIIHEVVHAELISNGTILQHSTMLKSYIDKMAGSLVSFFPNLTVQQALSLSLRGLGEEVQNSPAFDAVLAIYGFNKNNSSTDFFGNYALQFKTGDSGQPCNTGNNGPIE